MAQRSDAIPYYRELSDALAMSGCAVCTLTTRSAVRYVDNLLWQMVNELDVRASLKAARGYCQVHTWMLNRRGGALGVSILMDSVLKVLLDETDELTMQPRTVWDRLRRGQGSGDVTPAQLAAVLEPQALCPICSHTQGLEHDLLMTLLDQLESAAPLAPAYRASDGLCLAHFRKTLLRVQPRHNSALLLTLQRTVWERLRGELGEFIRKSDHRFHDEVIAPREIDGWQRAMALIAGPDPVAGREERGLTQSL